MTGLLSLSNELLIQVFASSLTIETAVCISGTHSRLRSIWLGHTSQIVTGILKPQIPAYDTAVDLAILEETLCSDAQLSSLPTKHHPVRLCLRRLLYNADLASSAATAWAAWIAELPADNYRRSLKFSSLHSSYYLIRKLVLAFRFPQAQLQNALYSTLRASSQDVLRTHDELCTYLCGRWADDVERTRHGIPKDEKDWTAAEGLDVVVNVDEWEYANEVVGDAFINHISGTETLKHEIFDTTAQGRC
jgi:hypothetical protein